MLQHRIMKLTLSLLFIGLLGLSFGQKTSSEIYVDLEKVHTLKRVLYIAAHPDDENTRALAWLSLGEKAETAYLSLTRGDGGQNLIGNELSEDLGVLRTQELLAARSIDGARQYFTRAVDFGYSKSAEESLEKWGKDEILSDVVLVIRQFKPDVIITRFPPDERAGHGHHIASSLLAIEAFEKAADPNFLPAQVAKFGAWKTTSIYWNSSAWWDKELPVKSKDNPDYLVAEIGGYNSLLGKSYNEIGTLARSQHKCQGFGAILERGSLIEYFQYLGGERLEKNFFEKNQTTWSKLVSAQFEKDFSALMNGFDFISPAENVPTLLKLRKTLASVKSGALSDLRDEKIRLLDEIIVNCLGLHIEILASDYVLSEGASTTVTYNLLNRSSINVQLMSHEGKDLVKLLKNNENLSQEIVLTNSAKLSTPYWLEQPFTTLFQVKDDSNLGRPENLPAFSQKISLLILGDVIDLTIPVVYKWKDPSYGERERALISTPEFTVNFDENSLLLKPGQEKTIRIKIHAFKKGLSDQVLVEAPEGWNVSPSQIAVNTNDVHEEMWADLTIKSTDEAQRGTLVLKNNKGENLSALTEIAYDHIPTQVIFKPAALTCVAINAAIVPGNIAYIKGAGDDVPQAIAQLGFDVSIYEVSDLSTLDLTAFRSVVLGIRIYNVSPELHNFDKKLFEYVEKGGNLIMQYNTASRNSEENKYTTIPFEISRNRVTEEDAEVTFLAPNHPLLNTPNKLSARDFNNWVQERGLYFASNWDERFIPLFSWHDSGEEAQKGALIVANYGKGQFIYTGISFFRELPNGVEGAYRLFANLLSYRSN